MQLADVLCYIVLTITVTTTCVRAEQQNEELEESQDAKRISKREATVLVDFNYSPADKIFQRPKVIYRRISKQRYGPPKPKYGGLKSSHGPPRPKSKPHKATRKPGKKQPKGRSGKPKSSLKYNPNKKRASKIKPKYGVPQFKPNSRPSFGHGHVVKMPHYSFFSPYRAAGFGEPPEEFFEHQVHKNAYPEPPVDSYGAPLKHPIDDAYPTAQSSQEPSHFDQDFKIQDQPWKQKHSQNTDDISYAFTKKEPTFTNFVTPTPKDAIDALDPIEDKHLMQDNKFFYRKKRPFYFADAKVVNLNRPWKPSKVNNEFEDELIVGGQYAEPPARYMAKFHQNSPVYEDDEDEASFPALHGYVDSDSLPAQSSTYSNYRHSNMAFSPQNLNDVFSVVNK